jgi:mannosyltransferase OCH1-like enzyme
MRLWTDENLPTDLVRKEAYEQLRKPAERADIIRLEVVLRFGGVYADADLECLRSIEPLLDSVEFCIARNRAGRISNALIGATAGHPILARAVKELRPRTEYGLDKSATGPIFLHKLIRQYPEITIFPPEYFHALSPDPGAFAVNHHARSWQDPEDLHRGLLKCERKLTEAQARIDELERWRNRRQKVAYLFRRAR